MLLLMTVLKRILVLTIAFQLAACGIATPAPTIAMSATKAPSLAPVNPTTTVPPPTPSSTATSSLPISSPPDELHMAYIIDGNLYFQDGSNSPIQLTYSGEDRAPIFSDDGEKIAFFRGLNPPFNLYSINIDGGGEQAIVTPSQLMALNIGYDESTAPFDTTFVPGTHRLLFRTFQSQEGTFLISNSDLLVVDTDTAEIKRLLPTGQVGAFYVSPDGRFIAIDTIEQIDVIDIGGKIIHQNLLTYTPSEPIFLPPGISWMPDSTGLIVILPVPTFYDTSGGPPSYTVWLYALNDSTGLQVSFDALPRDHYMARSSPDGNWIIYNNYDQNAFYTGDLRTGHLELYEPQPFVFHYDWSWSPDSKHFIYRASGKNLYLGSVNGSPELIGKGEFLGWIDSNRYLYYADKNIVMGDIKGSKEIILTDHESFKNKTIFTFILPEARKR